MNRREFLLALAGITGALSAAKLISKAEAINIYSQTARDVIEYKELAAKPTAPPTNYMATYFKTDHLMYKENPAGTETQIGGGGTGTSTVHVGAFSLSPQQGANFGNTYPFLIAMTAYESSDIHFVKDVEGFAYLKFRVPNNLSATPVGKIILSIMANATSGVTSLGVLALPVANAETFDPAALTAETIQDVTVPATAYLRTDVTFPLTEVVAADDILIAAVRHNGTKAEDTLAVDTILVDAVLECVVNN